MTNSACPLCKGEGWVCEQHPSLPFAHDDCAGPGDPCACNPGQAMSPGTRVIWDRERGYLQ